MTNAGVGAGFSRPYAMVRLVIIDLGYFIFWKSLNIDSASRLHEIQVRANNRGFPYRILNRKLYLSQLRTAIDT